MTFNCWRMNAQMIFMTSYKKTFAKVDSPFIKIKVDKKFGGVGKLCKVSPS